MRTPSLNRLLTVAAAVAMLAAPLQAQRADRALTVTPSAAQESRGSLPLEMLAGTAGSLAGMAIIGLNADCGVDDLGCIITAIGAAGALGAVGATIAVNLTARATGAPRSVLGAALGAVVGTGAGLGLHWLFNQNSDRNLDDKVVIPLFAASQGVFAALGSRALGR